MYVLDNFKTVCDRYNSNKTGYRVGYVKGETSGMIVSGKPEHM